MNNSNGIASDIAIHNTKLSQSKIAMYDYLTVETNEKFALEYIDCYNTLNWELVKKEKNLGLKTVLTFKRDRKINNKEQLNKIQVEVEQALSQINTLETAKTKKGFIVSIIMGAASALAFGGGMSLVMLNPALAAIVGGIALGVAGLGLGGLAYVVYKKICSKKTKAINVLIDKKRDELGRLCENAQNCINR